MKIRYPLLLLVCCLLTACNRSNDSATVSASDAYAKAQKDYDEQTKRQQAQLEAYDKHAKRAEEMLDKQEQLITRQQNNFERFEKILETWEKQQKQYQRYLDSLPK